ncbi:hypothetical protein G9A89_007024 [Geosiphon pyriformis]|nr:hypothetical protein G9A89_007024 [Geosiphon pyriformis]
MEILGIKRTRPETHDCSLCEVCQKNIQDNYNRCRICWFLFFEKLYLDFSSGNKVVDEIIKNPIYYPPDSEHNREFYNGYINYYSWIPWERLSNIKEIGRGGFGTIYKATVIDGLINEYTIKHHGEMHYERSKRNEEGTEVAIKFIQNSEEVFKELNIQRTMFNNNSKELLNISSIHGITQNAETLQYGIVMDFAKYGDMRKHLSTNFYSTDWYDKLSIAHYIAIGLDNIHSAGMVHRDLHSGNILQHDEQWVDIGDLGLCQLTNNFATRDDKKGIFGVVPYIPPEVLRGGKFEMAGDIYSLAMLLWELATGKPPFYDRTHDHPLIMDILNGARPKITSPLIPPCIAKIIEKCWDANPENRPTAEEVKKKLGELIKIYERREADAPEMEQLKESNKYVKEILKNDATTNYSITTTNIHSGAVYTSRLLSLQMIEETKG